MDVLLIILSIATVGVIGLLLFWRMSDYLQGRVTAEPVPTEVLSNLSAEEDSEGLGLDIESVIRELLSIQATTDAATSRNALVAYAQTLRARARVRGRMKNAELFEKQLSQIERILTSTTSIQNKSIELQKLFIDRDTLPIIHKYNRDREVLEAQRRYENSKNNKSEPEPSQRDPEERTITIDGIELGKASDDASIKHRNR